MLDRQPGPVAWLDAASGEVRRRATSEGAAQAPSLTSTEVGNGRGVPEDDPRPAHLQRGEGEGVLRRLPRLLGRLGTPFRGEHPGLPASVQGWTDAAPERASRRLLPRLDRFRLDVLIIRLPP